MTMPCPLVGRTKLSHRIRYFFIWSFVAAHVTCSNSEWGYRGFLWTKGTPKYISRNRAALVNISGEQGNEPNFWGSESGNLENSSFSMHWPYAFVIVRRQSQCFDALLSHLLVAGCDIGVRFSVRPSVHQSVRPSVRPSVCQHLCRRSTFMSKLVF